MNILRKLMLPIIAIFLILVIYGGLSINQLENKVNDANNSQNKLEESIASLEGKNAQNEKTIAGLQTSIASFANTPNQPQKVVTVRTSTATQTATAPVSQTTTNTITKNQATVTIQNVGSFVIDLQAGDTAFSILRRAASAHGFTVDYDTYSFGVLVKSIGGIAQSDHQSWAFYYNGVFSNVGASGQNVSNGDSTFWQLSNF